LQVAVAQLALSQVQTKAQVAVEQVVSELLLLYLLSHQQLTQLP
jgi:hypothetical protein